jgi:hypothetical protein
MMGAPTDMNVRERTIKDVARSAGVSTATVSRVVNNAHGVTCETRRKVLTAISRLQYRPNGHAAELGRANGGIPRKGIHEICEPAPRKLHAGLLRRNTEPAPANDAVSFNEVGIQ